MTEFYQQLFEDFGTKRFDLDHKAIDEFPFESLLNLFINAIKQEVDIIMDSIQHHRVVDEDMLSLINLVHQVERLQMHIELTLGVWTAESEEEVEKLKNKFTPIKKYYEKTKSREDVASVPLRHFLIIIHNYVFIKFRKLVKNCFEMDRFGEATFHKTYENLSMIKIIAGRFEVFDPRYPLVVNFPKDDIFCLPRSSPVWQDVYRSATFKQVLTKQEITSSFKQLHLILRLAHILVKRFATLQNSSNFKAARSILKDVLYYGSLHGKAETQALLHFVEPSMDEAFQAWNLTEHPIVAKFIQLKCPIIGYDEIIYIPRLFPRITKEVILKEYEDGTLNKIKPMSEEELRAPDFSQIKDEMLEGLFVEGENKIQIRILANDDLNLRKDGPFKFKGLVQKAAKVIERGPQTTETEEAIVIHIHGGGFVSMSSATHRIYLNRWVKKLKLVHFCVDYRLAPQNQYPDALDDVWQAYLWIINYAESILGIKNQKVILAGDSAGGNLACALMLRIVKAGLPAPHGCILIYPSLYVDAFSYSPSYFISFDDPMLPTSVLRLVALAYVGEEFNNQEDPFIGPMLASDELLEKMPPIRIVVGTDDPLYDDNWRLVHKLRKLKRDIKITVHENMPHAYLCNFDLKNHNYFVDETCEIVKELLSIETKASRKKQTPTPQIIEFSESEIFERQNNTLLLS